MGPLKYYVSFDAYGHARQAISNAQLAEAYQNDPASFLQAMCRRGSDVDAHPVSGHVEILSFNSPKELQEHLDSLGDKLDDIYNKDY